MTDDMEYQVVLNQADTEEQRQMAMQIAEEIGKKISKVHVTSDLIPAEERW